MRAAPSDYRCIAMIIRNAEEADLDRLAEIWHQGWHEAHAHLVPPELTRLRTLPNFRERLKAALPHLRVAGPPGAPLGFCQLQHDEPDDHDREAEAAQQPVIERRDAQHRAAPACRRQERPQALEHQEIRWVAASEAAGLELAPSDLVFWRQRVMTENR